MSEGVSGKTGTQCHGVVDMVVFGQRLDSRISEDFSNIIGSVS